MCVSQKVRFLICESASVCVCVSVRVYAVPGGLDAVSPEPDIFKGDLNTLGKGTDAPPGPRALSDANAMDVRASLSTVCRTLKIPVVLFKNKWSSGFIRIPQHTRDMHCPSLSPAQVHLRL